MILVVRRQDVKSSEKRAELTLAAQLTVFFCSSSDVFLLMVFQTHSAYMLFYKRVELEEENGKDFSFDVSPDLLEVILHLRLKFVKLVYIFT